MSLPGASEVAVILGLQRTHEDGEPWTSAFSLWTRLVGLVERHDRTSTSPDAELGRLLEPVVGLEFARRYSIPLRPGPTLDEPGLGHPSLPWTARPDFLATGATVEVKAPRALHPDLWGPDFSETWPAYYRVQVLAQVAVLHALGLGDSGYLAALARAPGWGSDRTWAAYLMPRNAQREAEVVGAVWAWVEAFVERQVPPPSDGSDSTIEALRRAWEPVDRKVREATPTDLEAYRRALASRTALEELRGRHQEARAALMRSMEDATELRYEGKLIATFGGQKRRTLRLRDEVTNHEEK